MTEKGEHKKNLKAEETVFFRGIDHLLNDSDLNGVKKPPSVDTEWFCGFDCDGRNSVGFKNTQSVLKNQTFYSKIEDVCKVNASGRKPKEQTNEKSCDFPSLEIKKRSSDANNEFDDTGVIFINSLPTVEDSAFKCPMCEHVSSNLPDLDIHLLSHKGKALYNCTQCDKRFPTDDYLKEHLLDHGGTQVYKCAECEFITTVRGTFYTHALIHIGVRPHKCSFCGQCFRTHSHLKNHKRRHTGEKPYCCTKCDYRASRSNTLKAHMLAKVHNDEKTYKCSICSSSLSDRSSLLSHMTSHSEERPFSCSTCGKNFKTKQSLEIHSVLHKRDFYYCSYCEFRTKHKSSLKHHERTHTGDNSHKKFECHLCGLRTAKKTLKFHLLSHSEVRAFKCNHCEYRAKTKCGLNEHEKIHNNYFVTCTVCQQNFSCKKYLKIHYLRCHTTERPFQCSSCDYAAVDKKLFKMHVMKHTGETPYRCEICNKGFRCSGSLLKHRRIIHSKVELLNCTMCSFCTKNKYNLNHHVRIKHDKERPYKCDVCPQTCIAKNALIAHMVQHSGLRPYKCHLCNYAGIEKRSLKAHVATHENNGRKRGNRAVSSDLNCSICPFLARGKTNFKKHLLLHVKKSYVKLDRLPI